MMEGRRIDSDMQISEQINDSHLGNRGQNPAYRFVVFLKFHMFDRVKRFHEFKKFHRFHRIPGQT